MNEWCQLAILSILQGLTEFLPVSSSAHLILLPILTGWEDQGLSIDISVHFGTLLAVILYFHVEIRKMAKDSWLVLRGQPQTPYSHMANQLILATIPVCLAGLLLHDFISSYTRNIGVIASTTLVFGLLLWMSIQYSKSYKDKVTYKQAILIGLAQVLALIPGTSRSGITITAALFLGLNKQTAARFAFLMSIPVILAAMTYETAKLVQAQTIPHSWTYIGTSILLSGLFALICIHFFLKLIDKIGLMPFVIYRLLLGCGLVILMLNR